MSLLEISIGRTATFIRHQTDLTGIEKIDEEGEIGSKVAQEWASESVLSTALLENLPMLIAKFAEMIETQNTISVFWVASIISGTVSILKAA